VAILRSQKNIKGVVVRVKAQAFGVEWAAEQAGQATFKGIIEKWCNEEKTAMMVLWEGSPRRKRTEIAALDVDTNKDDLELELEPYEDGRPAPVLVQPRAARPACGGSPAFDDSSENEDEAGEEEDESEAV